MRSASSSRAVTQPRILALAIALASGSALAQPAPVPVQLAAIETITILGTSETFEDIPGSAHRITKEDLEQHSFTDPGRILRTIPGVNVIDEEGLGQFPHISMRGVQPERNGRIAVMEDGVLVGSPAPYSASAAYYFPAMGRMEGVEVRKGSSAIQYGPNTVGGALNLISTQIPEYTSGQIHYRRGSNNGERTHAYAGGSGDRWGWLIENYAEQSDGFKELDYPTSGRLPNKPNNPVPEAGMDRNNSVAKLRWNSAPGAAVSQSLEFKYSLDERRVYDSYLGILAEDFQANPNRRYAGSQLDEINTENELFQLRHSIDFSETTQLVTTFYSSETVRNWYKLHQVDNANGSYVGITRVLQNPDANPEAMAWILGNTELFGAERFAPNAETRGQVRANNRSYLAQGVQTQLSHQFEVLGWEHNLQVGARYHEDEEDRLQWDDTYLMTNGTMSLVAEQLPGQGANRLSEASALALHAKNTMRRNAWTVVAGVRYEDIEQTRTDWSGPGRSEANLGSGRPRTNQYDVVIPGLGLTYQFTDQFSVLGGYHKGFSPAGDSPTSEPESADNFEAGFRFNNNGVRSQLIGFYNDYSNINIECTNVGGGCRDQDIGSTKSAGEVLIYGLEASIRYDLGRNNQWGLSIPINLAYTWTDSEFQQDIGSDAPNQWENARKGDSIPEIPEHQINLGIGLARANWSLFLNGNYVSEAQAFADPELSDLVLENRLLLDLAADYQLTQNARLTASVENLTDETYIAHHRPSGLRPGAPRTLWAGVKVSF
ncbi:TonB-dependent receptor domain-containing protein [Marinimicrobium sp. ABcell2]|uniref:TonB-dependent receptor family protein n=1 Tax=Marinimicrobium sp. ABcell2 TaxID=3069751 RepID=UPI0027AFB624|nr:TonB-dependent receptor [Marinimicrobium sp. ABcell2]MDQ2076409.1 TonB-dependent receptor [Marinimicrobium sp. ABcell2]